MFIKNKWFPVKNIIDDFPVSYANHITYELVGHANGSAVVNTIGQSVALETKIIRDALSSELSYKKTDTPLETFTPTGTKFKLHRNKL